MAAAHRDEQLPEVRRAAEALHIPLVGPAERLETIGQRRLGRPSARGLLAERDRPTASRSGSAPRHDGRTRAASRGRCQAGDPARPRSSDDQLPPAAANSAWAITCVQSRRRGTTVAGSSTCVESQRPQRPRRGRSSRPAIAHPHLALARVPPRRKPRLAVRAANPACQQRGLDRALADSHNQNATLLQTPRRELRTATLSRRGVGNSEGPSRRSPLAAAPVRTGLLRRSLRVASEVELRARKRTGARSAAAR